MDKTTKTDIGMVQPSDTATSPNNSTKKPESTLQDKTALPKLTRKQQNFVDILLSDKKISATESAMRAYNANNRNTAKSIATENLSKPAIQSHLAKHSDITEQVLLNTMTEWADHEKPRQREIAIDVAKYVHDKIHGRSKQQIEMSQNSVTLSINLTGVVSPDDTESAT